MSKYNSVTFVNQDNLEMLSQLPLGQEKELVVLIIDENEEKLQEIPLYYPDLMSYKKVGAYGYTSTYYYWAEGE